MALDAARLSASARAKLLANTASGAVDGPALTALCDAFAQAWVEEMTAHAAVVPTALVAPSGGGPVTGTGSVA